MTVKAIVTHLEPTADRRDMPHVSCALSLAEDFGAHLTALIFATEVMEAGAQPSEGGPASREAAATDELRDRAAKRGVSCEIRGRSSFAHGFPDVFADHARLNDLSVIAYGASPTAAQRMLAAGAIFSSGRPALMVPEAVPYAGPVQRVAIAWDATPASVRAVHNALPLLLRAEETFILSVTDDKEIRGGQSGIELAHLLARHGAKASFVAVAKGRQGVFDALTEATIRSQAELLVMGCVSHSPLYQMVFGSVSSDLLRGRATMAVLASA